MRVKNRISYFLLKWLIVNHNRSQFYILLFIGFPLISISQINFLKTAKTNIGLGLNLSTSGETPFWIRSNQNGTVPFKSNYLAFNFSSHSEYDSLYNKNQKLNKLGIGYGLSTYIFSKNEIRNFVLAEAYAKVRFSKLEFFAGRRNEFVGLVDSTLSSGSFAWSGNSLPIPQVKLHIPNFIPLIGKGLISFKGSFSHGWYGSQNYLKNVQLHHKSLYFKLGRPSWKINFYGGFNHQVQFGGELQKLKKLSSIKNGEIPSSFIDYIYAVTGVSLGNSKNQSKVDIDGYTGYDLTNRIGNHFGSIDVAMNIFTKFGTFYIYRQSVYDDGSLFYLINLSDGLSGISFKPLKTRVFNKIVLEFFNSKSQGGHIGPIETQNAYLRGQDDYFNHGQFIDGWSNKYFTSGTPFISPQLYVKDEFKLYVNSVSADIPYGYFTSNNRVNAIYLNLALNVLNSDLNLIYSHSSNLGTYRHPFQKSINQNCSMIQIKKQLLNKMKFRVNISFDDNGIFNNTLGTLISLQKEL